MHKTSYLDSAKGLRSCTGNASASFGPARMGQPISTWLASLFGFYVSLSDCVEPGFGPLIEAGSNRSRGPGNCFDWFRLLSSLALGFAFACRSGPDLKAAMSE